LNFQTSTSSKIRQVDRSWGGADQFFILVQKTSFLKDFDLLKRSEDENLILSQSTALEDGTAYILNEKNLKGFKDHWLLLCTQFRLYFTDLELIINDLQTVQADSLLGAAVLLPLPINVWFNFGSFPGTNPWVWAVVTYKVSLIKWIAHLLCGVSEVYSGKKSHIAY
jgi:hypothetical protein